jgi:hypothetical protein
MKSASRWFHYTDKSQFLKVEQLFSFRGKYAEEVKEKFVAVNLESDVQHVAAFYEKV